MSKKYKICIECGHGGSDPGAVSKDNKTKESAVALAVGLKVFELLNGEIFDVWLDRVSDTGTQANMKAVEILPLIQAEKPDLFFAIHCNSFDKATVRGFEVYNRFDGITAKHKDNSLKFSNLLVERFEKILPPHGEPLKQDKFTTLYGDYPSAYIELAYISNLEDLKLLRNNQDDFAAAISGAVCEFFGVNSVVKKYLTTQKITLKANTWIYPEPFDSKQYYAKGKMVEISETKTVDGRKWGKLKNGKGWVQV
jgi:N-acetylmuramoyl-L-alanine amidase